MSAQEHDQATKLLAAWAVDTYLPEETAFVESHVAGCAECAVEAASLRETARCLPPWCPLRSPRLR